MNQQQFFTHFNINRIEIELLTWICKTLLATKMFNFVVRCDSFFYRVICTVGLSISSTTLSSIFLNQLPKYMTKQHEYLLPLIIVLSIIFNYFCTMYRNVNGLPKNHLFNENNIIIKIVSAICCVILGMDDVFSIYIRPLHRAQETMVGCFVMGFLSVSLGTIISSIVRKVNTGEPNILENPSLDFIVINIMVTSYYFLKDYGNQTITLISGLSSKNYFVDEIILMIYSSIYLLIYFLNIISSSNISNNNNKYYDKYAHKNKKLN